MKLIMLKAFRYRSLADLTFEVGDLNLLIGCNASGKSNILDALRFLSEAVSERDFAGPVYSRGGLLQLAWKGKEAKEVEIETLFEDAEIRLRWLVRITKERPDFEVDDEALYREPTGQPREELLRSHRGRGFWYSQDGRRVPLNLPPSGCALAAAAADESFPGREAAEFVKAWGFFDPSPGYLRQGTAPRDEGAKLDTFGRNLAGRLYQMKEDDPSGFERIVSTVRSLLGVPDTIEPRLSEDGSLYFVEREPGLIYPVNQKGVSAGTLRMLALITAILGEGGASLVGIEEPENYIHPNALSGFAQYLEQASKKLQVIVTTHSPLLLNFLRRPEAVCVVKRTAAGTEVERERDPQSVQKALEESGFGLGDFHETKGFGS